MKDTLVFDMTDPGASAAGIEAGASALRRGGTVVFPTETVYGLGADAASPQAVAGIFEAKGRPSDNPLIVHLAEPELIGSVTSGFGGQARILAREFMPGPITLVLNKNETVCARACGGLATVGVRVPDHPVALALIRAAGVPVAAPSANISGRPSPTRPAHVLADMYGRADVILLAGDCMYGLESTVVDCTRVPFAVLRPGAVPEEEIARALGASAGTPASGEVRSPGVKYAHYRPSYRVIALMQDGREALEWLNSRPFDPSEACLVFDETAPLVKGMRTFSLGSSRRPREAAGLLFAQLRAVEGQGVDTLYVMRCRDAGIGRAFNDRLERASGGARADGKRGDQG